MTELQTNIMFAFIGIMIWDLCKIGYRCLRKSANEKLWSLERDKALDTIKEAEFNAHYYLPSVGHRKNKSLSGALDSLAGKGFIITDKGGNLVGKVAKARLNSNEVAEAKRATFTIVK